MKNDSEISGGLTTLCIEGGDVRCYGVSDCEEIVWVQFLNRFKTNYFTQKFHSVFRLTANLSIANLQVVTILTA